MFHHFGYGGMGFGGMIIGGLVGFALLVGLIWFIVWAVRRISGKPMHGMHMHPMMGGQVAKDVAQMRYAKGEINREEYQQLIEDLSR
jgi:putative membrane protein